MMMTSSICALILDYTSESALLNHPDFNYSSLYQLIARCLASPEQVNCEFPFIIGNINFVKVVLLIPKILLRNVARYKQ